MGIEVEREEFTDEERAQFSQRLQENLKVLRELLASPGFGIGETTIGVEVEMDAATGTIAMLEPAVA